MLDIVRVSCASGLKGSNPKTRLSFEALTRVLYNESGCAEVKAFRAVANECARTCSGRDCSSPTVMVGYGIGKKQLCGYRLRFSE